MITVRLKGGLGNQMFQYALGRALSLKNKTDLLLDLGYLLDRTPRAGFTFRDYNLDVFDISVRTINKKESLLWKIYLKVFPFRGKEKSFAFDPAILSLGDGAYLDGYWQSEKYFASISETIRKDFRLKDPLPESTLALLEEIKNADSLCVHVRRGDYIGNSFHPTLPLDYYHEGIEYISKKSNIGKIYVFSDDTAWCRENLEFAKETVFVGPEHAGKYGEGHMFLMSACRNFVIANSSFSWWGAWLGESPEKIVVAPKKWFGPGVPTRDLIPENWIKI